jgi:hypothetical protein
MWYGPELIYDTSLISGLFNWQRVWVMYLFVKKCCVFIINNWPLSLISVMNLLTVFFHDTPECFLFPELFILPIPAAFRLMH